MCLLFFFFFFFQDVLDVNTEIVPFDSSMKNAIEITPELSKRQIKVSAPLRSPFMNPGSSSSVEESHKKQVLKTVKGECPFPMDLEAELDWNEMCAFTN